MESRGRDVVIISDLHMSAGIGFDGNYSGTEDFFADAGFVRFIESLGGAAERKTILVINGDFVDFLRVTALPDAPNDFGEWSALLERLGITPADDLKQSIDDKEREYGLKTHEYKSVWKLSAVMKGHPEVFTALAGWLVEGNSLVIVKGNHDLEWYWPGVRNYLRLALADRILAMDPDCGGLDAILRTRVLPLVYFVDDSITFDGTFYIEHGHKLDKYTEIVGKPVLPNGVELNIPFGSFLNRYLLNRIELVYPFLDNIRPSQNLLPMLFKKDFGLGLRVLFQHIPFMLKIIPKKYYRYMFRDFLVFLLAVAAPIAVMIFLLVKAAKSNPGLAVPQTGLEGMLVTTVHADTGVHSDAGALLFPHPAGGALQAGGARLFFETGSGDVRTASGAAVYLLRAHPQSRAVSHGRSLVLQHRHVDPRDRSAQRGRARGQDVYLRSSETGRHRKAAARRADALE